MCVRNKKIGVGLLDERGSAKNNPAKDCNNPDELTAHFITSESKSERRLVRLLMNALFCERNEVFVGRFQ